MMKQAVLLLVALAAVAAASPAAARVAAPAPVEASAECALCEFVLKELDSLLAGNSSEAAVEAALDKVCDVLPATLKNPCEALVKQETPALIQYLVNELDPTKFCTVVGLCKNSTATKARVEHVPVTVIDAPEASAECALCEFVLKELDSLLAGNSSEAAVEAALDKVCDVLPATLKNPCESFVKQEAPALIQYLVNELDPTKFCTVVGLCKNSTATKARVEHVPVPVVGAPEASAECALCEFVLKELDKIVPKNKSIAEIEKALLEVCEYLPSSLQSDCEGFVKAYGPEVIKEIFGGMPPSQVCTIIGLCEMHVAVPEPTKVEGVECALCEFVLKELDKIIGTNKTEAEIEKALQDVCSVLPSSLQSDCDTFVKTYGPMIIKDIISGLAPSAVCSALGLCSETRVAVPEPTKVEGVECALCEFVLKELDKIIGTNKTEAEIEKALQDVCSVLPSSLQSDCDTFVKTYGPMIIKDIISGLAPSAVCSALGLCSETRVAVPEPTKVEGVECALCEFVLKELDKIIGTNKTEAEIEKALQDVCSVLPSSLQSDCDTFVKTYGPMIIKDIISGLAPSAVCSALGLCSEAKAVEGKAECVICELIVKEVDSQLANNRTEANVEKALDNVCGDLPKTISGLCQDFVNDNTVKLTKLLSQALDPSEVCTSVGACAPPMKH